MNNWSSLSPESRLWIYGAKRKLTIDEEQSIINMLENFCAEWSAHGTKLDCGFTILHSQIIVLGVDEKSAQASGCSIDTSVQVFRDIDNQFDLDLFNRLRVYHLDGEKIQPYMAHEIKSSIANQKLDAQSQFIDTLAPTKSSIEQGLTKAMESTWLSKYL